MTPLPTTYAPASPTVTLLGNGNILVAGGLLPGATTGTNLAELYNPKTNTWKPTSKTMNVKRVGHTATLLGDGFTVLVVGGDAPGAPGTAELYDSNRDTWTPLAKSTSTNQFSPAYSHIYHTATLLPTGQVLIVGGFNSVDATSANCGTTSCASVELYEPSTNTWDSAIAATPTLTVSATMVTGARFHHTATLLPNGTVLIAGGTNGSGAISDAEIFTFTPAAGTTPADGVWTSAGAGTATATTCPSLCTASYSHTATLLSDGTVLIVGGSGAGGALSRVELFNPAIATLSFSTQSYTLSTARYNHIATSLADGTVLIAGGDNATGTLASAELCDNTTCLTNAGLPYGGNLTYARDQFGAVLLNSNIGANSGKVLLVGGQGVTAVETFQ